MDDNTDFQSEDGETALMIVAMQRFIPSHDVKNQLFMNNNIFSIVDLLIKAGATVDMRNNKGETALMLALNARQYAIVDLLILAGADLGARDEEGKTALDWALKSEWCEGWDKKAFEDIYRILPLLIKASSPLLHKVS